MVGYLGLDLDVDFPSQHQDDLDIEIFFCSINLFFWENIIVHSGIGKRKKFGFVEINNIKILMFFGLQNLVLFLVS